jgi:hypothetical protein
MDGIYINKVPLLIGDKKRCCKTALDYIKHDLKRVS